MAHIPRIELMGIGRYGCFKSTKPDEIPNMHDVKQQVYHYAAASAA